MVLRLRRQFCPVIRSISPKVSAPRLNAVGADSREARTFHGNARVQVGSEPTARGLNIEAIVLAKDGGLAR